MNAINLRGGFAECFALHIDIHFFSEKTESSLCDGRNAYCMSDRVIFRTLLGSVAKQTSFQQRVFLFFLCQWMNLIILGGDFIEWFAFCFEITFFLFKTRSVSSCTACRPIARPSQFPPILTFHDDLERARGPFASSFNFLSLRIVNATWINA